MALSKGLSTCPAAGLRFYCVHLNYLNQVERLLQLDYLLPKMLEVPLDGATISGSGWNPIPELPTPDDFVMLGDHNLTPDSPEYTRIVGELDYYYGARITARHLVDTWVQSGHARDAGVTWYDRNGNWAPGTRIDYIFVNPRLAGSVKDAWIDDDTIASDHQPVWVELEI